MPTILENILEELGTGLDDKARQALTQVDSVSALAFLQRISDRGEQVRNPSAFIATAVRNAGGRGPGPAELESALQRLRQDGTLDESAVDALHKGVTEDACQAVASLLAQEVSAVRNASAYVTRNIANARKQSGVPMMARGGPMGMMQTVVPMAAAMALGPASGEVLLAKWGPALDHKAMSALLALGAPAATAVLQEMDSKAASVRNPSAYVQRACENRKEGFGLAASVPTAGSDMGFMGFGGMGGGGGCLASLAAGGCMGGGMGGGSMGGGCMFGGGGLAGSTARFSSMLDSDAVDALQKVSPEQASGILANLEARAGSVRNPSAYVVRSVKNLQDGTSDNGASSGHTSGGTNMAGTSSTAGSTADVLASLAASTRSPSAFALPVTTLGWTPTGAMSGKGSRNTMGEMGSGADAQAHQGPLIDTLDESARQALNEIGGEAAAAIIQQLESQAGKVNNPSAYVLRAVGNARRGKGAGGAAAGGAAAHLGLQEELQKLETPLDAKAMAALEEVGPVAAAAIMQKLNRQGGTVNNPNAYIMRAVGNEKRGLVVPGTMGMGMGAIAGGPLLKRQRL
eukprot:CAMPEP_0179182060 /NCGR_PEP_ID=MMETSP0796-20121207/90194_1 /TAXON_ID=73915 /ORGANISM="Pyrodinium bahamense, Strain pbaha01" /LENGTH=572 /DNA_ID=CAMNT_0020885877 /DNA_START=57 /DNA_END=1775 /DNA_ORIENTATION=-